MGWGFTSETLYRGAEGAGSVRRRSESRCEPRFSHVCAHRCALAWRESEEPRTAPGCPCDRAGNGGKAVIRRALLVETVAADGDGMALALIFTHQHRAGFELAPGRATPTRQGIEESQALAIETAKGLFLEPPAIIRPSRSVLRPAGGLRPNTARQRHRRGSGASERMQAISASIAAGSVRCCRMVTHSAHLRCRWNSCRQ
jgi:hypothetical protein